jgi:hypothetical protein
MILYNGTVELEKTMLEDLVVDVQEMKKYCWNHRNSCHESGLSTSHSSSLACHGRLKDAFISSRNPFPK